MPTPRRTDDPLVEALAIELQVEATRKRMAMRTIAEKSGLPYSTVAKCFQGVRMTDIVELQLIARALGTRAGTLLDRAMDELERQQAAAAEQQEQARGSKTDRDSA